MFAPILICSLALGIDYGYLTLQQRSLQKSADLAAIVAASDIENGAALVASQLALNDEPVAVETEYGLLLGGGYLPDSDVHPGLGLARLWPGRYTPDPALPVSGRFVKTDLFPNAARVTIAKPGILHFGNMFMEPPELSAAATASSVKLAAITVGSRLARLDAGIANRILGAMLGTEISLTVMDYEALLNADVSLFAFMDALAGEIGLTAFDYETLLQTEIAYPRLVAAMRHTAGLPSQARTALHKLQSAKGRETFALAQLVRIDRPAAGKAVIPRWDMDINAMQLVSIAARLAHGERQIALASGLDFASLATLRLDLAIGEPPAGTPGNALAPVGTKVRTAQTRLYAQIELPGLVHLAGSRIHLPLFIELAHGEAMITDVDCELAEPRMGTVDVSATPGIARIGIGAIDHDSLHDFSTPPAFQPAGLVDIAGVVRISGRADVKSADIRPSELSFSKTEVARNAVKTVSTRDMLGSLTASLADDLHLTVDLLGLSLPGSQSAFESALAASLHAVAAQIDDLIYNTLSLAGIRVGEIDVRASGVNCSAPVLIQ